MAIMPTTTTMHKIASASIGAVAAAVGVQDGSDDEIDDNAATQSSRVRVPSVDASNERLS